MFADRHGAAPRWRTARECALGVCVAWLVVQNLAILIALLVGGTNAAWTALTPMLALAFLVMTPLWLVPVIAFFVIGRHARRNACPGTHEVTS